MMSKKIFIKSDAEIEKMRISGRYLAQMMDEIELHCKEGVTGKDLDKVALDFCKREGVKPAFLGLYGFKNVLCIGINDNCVHGIPDDRKFKAGDIVTVDAGVIYDGFYSDMAKTFYIGEPSKDVRQLVEVVRQSINNAIKEAKIGNHIGAISHAIRSTVQPYGYSPLIEFVGHGIGRSLHEEPAVPGAYYERTDGPVIKKGMVIAIESIISAGSTKVIIAKDGWTTRTSDGSLFALFEHTVLPTENGGEILTKVS